MRRLYVAYEWLRDGASPFDAMTACRLQSPSWWRTARDALAAASALLDAVPKPAASPAHGQPLDGDRDQLTRAAAAIRWVFEAAVALRLPYAALQPADAFAMGWRGACQDTACASGDAAMAWCRAVLAAAGVRCRCEGISPERLAAALDHTEHTHAVCYTEHRSHL